MTDDRAQIAEKKRQKRELLGTYHIGKNREGKVYWSMDPERPVEIDIVRVADGRVLLSLRRQAQDFDILEVQEIIKNARRSGKLPSGEKEEGR